MAEDHGLSRAPVLVIDLRTILGRDCRHGRFSFQLLDRLAELRLADLLPCDRPLQQSRFSDSPCLPVCNARPCLGLAVPQYGGSQQRKHHEIE